MGRNGGTDERGGGGEESERERERASPHRGEHQTGAPGQLLLLSHSRLPSLLQTQGEREIKRVEAK